ncbi:MAG: protein-L-isoaspartate(D-aspartate) O-methyltransferase [Chitinispirillaceae bacterium]|jgi:protein-L-isoaspartate(D-aspartate) O-methyltransferase
MEFLDPHVAVERLIKVLRANGIADRRILDAFRRVPRHLFVDGAMYAQAYDDNALPIGFGQTISQPTIVARMTELLDLRKDEKVLEIGTGSGFQTAILAQFTIRIYSIENIGDLSIAARQRLRSMGYQNIVFRHGDGSLGWAQHAPYAKILVTAAAPVAPAALCEQLEIGGRMVIPVGDHQQQEIEVYDRTEKGFEKRSEGAVVFVPLVGKQGWHQG